MATMKKSLVIAVMALLMLGIMPLIMAEEGSGSEGDSADAIDADSDIRTETKIETISDDGERVRIETRERIKDGVLETRERLEAKSDVREDDVRGVEEIKMDIRERASLNREELIARMGKMDPEKLRRLEALGNLNLERIAGLNAEEREKLAELKEEKLRRIAELDKEHLEKVAELEAKLVEKFATLSRAEQGDLAGLDVARLRERLDRMEFKAVRSADDLKARVIVKERMELARERFDDAEQRYEKSREDYRSAREEYLKAKDSGNEQDALEHAKEVLLHSADTITSHLEKIKEKVSENERISEEAASRMTAEIDSSIAAVADIRERAETAETAEDIRALAKELNAAWKGIKVKAEAFAERVITARVEGIVHQGIILEKKLDAALARMEEQGIEVDVSAQVETFSNLIDDAKENFELAKQKLEEAQQSTDRENANALVGEAKDLIANAQESLKEAHAALREIVSTIREAGQELEIDDDAEVEVEVEDDDGDDDAEEEGQELEIDDDAESSDDSTSPDAP